MEEKVDNEMNALDGQQLPQSKDTQISSPGSNLDKFDPLNTWLANVRAKETHGIGANDASEEVRFFSWNLLVKPFYKLSSEY